jgi:mortality factor 4-like protein 1
MYFKAKTCELKERRWNQGTHLHKHKQRDLMSEPPPATYATGENALCYHGPLLYVAKVLTVQWPEDKHPMTGKEGWHYFVHYRGWKTACVLRFLLSISPKFKMPLSWDEWVTSERLLKDNETNRVIQRELEKNAPAGSRKTSSSGAAKDGGAGTSASANAKASARKETGPRGTKRGRDDVGLIFARRPNLIHV